MAIDINKATRKTLSQTVRKYKTPKSIRLQQSELQSLEDFKKQLKEITQTEYCSDTQAFKVLLSSAKYINSTILKRALSDVL
jgi:NRPS condensation-like uncharacterized protein